jgi:hypothetical protein
MSSKSKTRPPKVPDPTPTPSTAAAAGAAERSKLLQRRNSSFMKSMLVGTSQPGRQRSILGG